MVQCSQCEFKATSKAHLQIHVKSIHEGQKFPCTQCGSTFTQKENLQTHIKSVHEGQKFHCTHCGSTYTDKGTLQKHIKSVHEGVSPPYLDENNLGGFKLRVNTTCRKKK